MTPTQPCGVCPHRTTCWKTPRATAVALAVCRMKNGIDVDQSAARLVDAAWPDLVKIGRRIDAHDPETAARELAHALVLAVPRYDFGDRGSSEPIWWLLTGKRSAVRIAATNMLRARTRHRARYTSLPDEDAVPALIVESEDLEGALLGSAAWAVVEDGITLSTYEYRVLTYIIDNAKGRYSGIQGELAARMGVTRPRITRLYHLAIARVLCAMGETDRYFERKDVALPTWANARRRYWAAHVRPRPYTITDEQHAELTEITQRVRLTEAEFAWAFGIADPAVVTSR